MCCRCIETSTARVCTLGFVFCFCFVCDFLYDSAHGRDRQNGRTEGNKLPSRASREIHAGGAAENSTEAGSRLRRAAIMCADSKA